MSGSRAGKTAAAIVAVLYFGGKKLGVQDYLPPSLGGPEPSASSDEDE